MPNHKETWVYRVEEILKKRGQPKDDKGIILKAVPFDNLNNTSFFFLRKNNRNTEEYEFAFRFKDKDFDLLKFVRTDNNNGKTFRINLISKYSSTKKEDDPFRGINVLFRRPYGGIGIGTINRITNLFGRVVVPQLLMERAIAYIKREFVIKHNNEFINSFTNINFFILSLEFIVLIFFFFLLLLLLKFNFLIIFILFLFLAALVFKNNNFDLKNIIKNIIKNKKITKIFIILISSFIGLYFLNLLNLIFRLIVENSNIINRFLDFNFNAVNSRLSSLIILSLIILFSLFLLKNINKKSISENPLYALTECLRKTYKIKFVEPLDSYSGEGIEFKILIPSENKFPKNKFVNFRSIASQYINILNNYIGWKNDSIEDFLIKEFWRRNVVFNLFEYIKYFLK